MRSFGFVMLLSLAGCPPPSQYLITDVVAARAPVDDALVAADCGDYHQAARRTDDRGRARLALSGKVDPSRCLVTVAKPGYRTVETPVAATCTDATACPAMLIWLDRALGTVEVAQ
jgi:hypothetical protein